MSREVKVKTYADVGLAFLAKMEVFTKMVQNNKNRKFILDNLIQLYLEARDEGL